MTPNESDDIHGRVRWPGGPGVPPRPAPKTEASRKARPNEVAGLYRKKYRMTETTIQYDEDADIEQTADGLAIIQGGCRVELSETLANRLAIQIFAARRRAS